ncbi:MAG: site-specific integrase [Gammaproteobacteria bacterium]
MFRRIRLGDIVARYLDEVTRPKRGAHSEAKFLRRLLREPLCRVPIRRLCAADFAAYRDARLQSVRASTVRLELSILGGVLERARREWGLLRVNPVRDVRLPPAARGRTRRLDARTRETERLFAACRGAYNKRLLPLVELALETAARRGELLALRWEHVDLTRRTVHLPVTKNGFERTVPLSARARDVLRALGPRPAGMVFEGLSANAVDLAFRRAVRRAGLVDLHFHDLRHEATTRFFEKGLTMMEVASITGHRDPRMLRGYAHLEAEKLAAKLR